MASADPGTAIGHWGRVALAMAVDAPLGLRAIAGPTGVRPVFTVTGAVP